MASLLDIVFIPDSTVEFLAQKEHAEPILKDFATAGNATPEVFAVVIMLGRIGAALREPGEQVSEFELGEREGRRALALELLSFVKASGLSDAEVQDLIMERGVKTHDT